MYTPAHPLTKPHLSRIKHKGTLKDDGASTEALVEALEALSRMHFTYKILLQTKVGKSVRRLNYNTSSSVRKVRAPPPLPVPRKATPHHSTTTTMLHR